MFPGAEDYMIVPQYKRPTYPQSIDFTTIYIVKLQKCPVLFLEIKASGHIKAISDRAAADEQMRERFEALASTYRQAVWDQRSGGTKICIYTYDAVSDELSPPRIQRDVMRVNDRAPADRWNLDILQPDGEARMRGLVNEVKAMRSQLISLLLAYQKLDLSTSCD
ncbi:hypothetical protein C8J56DRAFT_955417 [Mycena floridula]|nr:hypothetical protein C8J56DRAFT_955417 [Mycena floridula]